MGILAKKINKTPLTSKEIELNIDKILKRLLSISNPTKIYLFGSNALNKSTVTSDYDIALIYQRIDELKIEKKKIYQANLFKDIEVDLLFYTIDIFSKKSKIGGVAFDIKNYGKVIYDKESKI